MLSLELKELCSLIDFIIISVENSKHKLRDILLRDNPNKQSFTEDYINMLHQACIAEILSCEFGLSVHKHDPRITPRLGFNGHHNVYNVVQCVLFSTLAYIPPQWSNSTVELIDHTNTLIIKRIP